MADLQRGQGSTMDFLMRMPDLATVDATVTVVAWLKEPGEQVKRGEPLLEVETDKAILPVESPVLGVLCEITAPSGSEVETGQVIARLTVDERRLAYRRAFRPRLPQPPRRLHHSVNRRPRRTSHPSGQARLVRPCSSAIVGRELTLSLKPRRVPRRIHLTTSPSFSRRCTREWS